MQNQVIQSAFATVTMTSLELVEFINSQRYEGEATVAHSDFLKKVPIVLGEGVAGKFSCYYKASNGKQNPMYRFPKREACLMAMSYSYDLQAKVFDRMTELEQQVAKPVDPIAVLNDPAAMRGLLLSYTEKVLALQETVSAQTPKVSAFDRIATASDGSMCITNAAKALQVQPKKLFQYLSENRWIYRRAGAKSWTAYQDRLQSGLLEAKVSTVEKTDGSERVVENTHVTAKGLARLAAAFGVTINQDDLFQGAAA